MWLRHLLVACFFSSCMDAACPPGQYNSGEMCSSCGVCTAGNVRVDCFGVSAGECVNIEQASPTPPCGRDTLGVNSSFSLTLSLGGHTFHEVFGMQPLDFQCTTTICDGRQANDTTQCTRARACDTVSCMTEVTSSNQEPRACPVLIDPVKTGDETWKTLVKCQSCSECGTAQANFRGREGWGMGCARECTHLLCDDGEVYDWTDRKCKGCAALWNPSLCVKSEDGKDVTGHLLRVRFPECRARGGGEVGYGQCWPCTNSSCPPTKFPDSRCGCSLCMREGARSRVYIDGNNKSSTLFCQISACASSQTGVHLDGTLCNSKCAASVCNSGERMVQCILPHDTRCVPEFPRAQRARRVGVVNASANLLETTTGPWHGWSSFENILVTMAERDFYQEQCVWNSAGITDNAFYPGGIAAAFWPRGVSSAAEYKNSGTKKCRARAAGWAQYPLLPLQNTVSFEGDATRRVLVNSTMRVVSYAYVNTGYEFRTTEPAWYVPDAGDLLAVLDLKPIDRVHIRLTTPRDRKVVSWARWWRLSLFVYELTQIPPPPPILTRAQVSGALEQFPSGGLGNRATLINPVLENASIPARARFVSAMAEMLYVSSDSSFIASNESVDVLDCVHIACAAIGLGQPPDDAEQQVFFSEVVASETLAVISTAGTPRGHRCLVYTGTIVGVFCVAEMAFLVSDIVSSAMVYVGGLDGVVLLYNTQYTMLQGASSSKKSVFVNGPVLSDVHAMAPGSPLQSQSTFVVLIRVQDSDESSVRVMEAHFTTATTITYWEVRQQCTIQTRGTCNMATASHAVLVACVDDEELRMLACTTQTVVEHTGVELHGSGMLSLVLLGSRAVVGRNGFLVMFSFIGSKFESIYIDAFYSLFNASHFVQSSGGYVLFGGLVVPSYDQCIGWHVDELQSLGIAPPTSTTCFQPAIVSQHVTAAAWIHGYAVNPLKGGIFTRSAVSLNSAWLIWSPATLIQHRGAMKYASTQSLAPVASGGHGSVYMMPSAVMLGAELKLLKTAWRVKLESRYGLFVFVHDKVLEVKCDEIVLAKCNAGQTAVQFIPEEKLVLTTCFPGAISIKAGTACETLDVIGESDIALYTADGSERTMSQLTNAVTIATAMATTGTSNTMCEHAGEHWWTCQVVLDGIDALTLAFARADEFDMTRYVGVDDIQVLPMLADYMTSHSNNVSWTTLYSPLYTELQTAHVEGAFERFTNTSGWERLHVLVGIFTTQSTCTPVVRLWALDGFGRVAEQQHGLQALGCSASLAAITAMKAYASCSLEIPTSALNAKRVVRVAVEGCGVVTRVDASIPPHMSLSACAPEEYFAVDAQACVSCGNSCGLGMYSTACAALTGDQQCKTCPSLSTHEEFFDGCARRCKPKHRRVDGLCQPCSVPSCTMGTYLMDCTQDTDTTCASCLTQANAHFAIPGSCDQVCDPGFFKSERSVCERCSTVSMLRAGVALLAHSSFFRMHNCTAVADAFYEICVNPPLGYYVANSNNFSTDCELLCPAGSYLVTDSSPRTSTNPTMAPLNAAEQLVDAAVSWNARRCVACNAPLGPTGVHLPPEAYVMDNSCTPSCVAPYYAHGGTCVECNEEACPVGTYLSGALCDVCRPCVSKWTDTNFRFISRGSLENNATCQERCVDGMYNEFDLGTCKNYSKPVCSEAEFLRTGSVTQDYECRPCASCDGRRLVQRCEHDHDTVCESCGDTGPFEIWNGTACEKICRPGYIRNHRTRECELCAFTCPPGLEPAHNRDNCTHCQECIAPNTSNYEWISGCYWACQFGFELQNGLCLPHASNDISLPTTLTRIRCPQGTKPHDLFDCEACSVSTVTPPEIQENVTWIWLTIGEPCQWTCTMPLVKHAVGTGIACIPWEKYKRIATLSTATPQITGLQNPVIMLKTLNRWEVFVASGCLLLLIVIIVTVKVV